jgi:TusA-related sulfurtransferase
MPLIALSEAVAEMQSGMVLEVIGDDPVFEIGVRDFCEARGHEVIEVEVAESFVTMRIRI